MIVDVDTLGAIIGAEREISDKPAVLRTHAVLAAAAALFVGLAEPLVACIDNGDDVVKGLTMAATSEFCGHYDY